MPTLQSLSVLISHANRCNDFFYSVWNGSLCQVKSQQGSYLFSLSPETTNSISQLANLLVSRLENIRIYTVGEDLYLVGQTDNQNWLGIHHVVPSYGYGLKN